MSSCKVILKSSIKVNTKEKTMALKGSYTDKTGVTHSSAYLRIEEVNQNKKRQGAHITCAIYHTETAKDDGMQPVAQKSYDLPYTVSEATEDQEAVVIAYSDVLGVETINPQDENDWKSVYENLLKQLEEFSDWQDA